MEMTQSANQGSSATFPRFWPAAAIILDHDLPIMKQLGEDIFILEGFPPYAINVYLIGEVLVDAATRFAAARILRRLRGRTVTLHALTHAHPDHQGSSHVICETLGIPLWCGERDADAMEQEGEIMARMPRHWLSRAIGPIWTGPPHPVARRLREGDRVGSFRVLETPGHTDGHVSFWREGDGVLVLGDVLANMNIWTGMPMLCQPQRIFSRDPALNRLSARRLLELDPKLICFGHGPPLRDSERFVRFVKSLRDS
jgi:glyoxylase-like metal-dependent hydrolase (beta-lactamase superfamily II)